METEARKIARGSEISCSLESESVVADNSKTLNEIVDESSLSTRDELHGVDKEENVTKEEEEEAEKEEGIIIEKRSEEEEQQENEEEETEVKGVKEKEEEAEEEEKREEEESVEEETQTEVLKEEKEEAAGEEGEQEENKGNKKEKEEEDKQEEEEYKEEEEIHSEEIKEGADENVGKPDKAAGVEEHIKQENGGQKIKPELIKKEEEVENESGEEEEQEKQKEEDKEGEGEKENGEENECRKVKELLKEEDRNEVEINEKEGAEGECKEGNEEDADIIDNLEKWLSGNSKEGEDIKEEGEKVKEEEKEIEKEEKDDGKTQESVGKDDEQKKEVDNDGVEGEEGNKEAANRMKSRDSISQGPIMEEPKEGKEEAVKEKNKKFEEKEKQENERVDEKEIYKIGEREMEKEEMEVSIGEDEEQKEAVEEQEKEAVGGEEGSEEAVNRTENHGSVNQAPSPEEPLSRNLKAGNEDGRVEEEGKEESGRVEEKEIGKIEEDEVAESIGEEEEQKEDVERQKKKGAVEKEVTANGMENHASANQAPNLEEPYCNDPTEGVTAEECDASDDSTIPRDPDFDVRIVEEKQNSVCIDWTPSPEAEVYKIEKFHRRRGWEQVAWVGYAPTTVSDLAENFTYRLRIKAQRFCEARGLFEDYKMSPDFLVTTLSPLPTTLSLHRAIKKGQQFLVKRILRRRPSLLEHPGPNGYLPLANAIIDGQNSVIDVLLSHGGNVQIGNPLNARTPLQLAFYYGRLAVARILLNRKAQLEAVDINDMTACHFAVDANQLELLRFALENGANVNATDACGWSLLSRAVVMGSDVCVLKLLLTHGADPKSKDKMGKTCVDLAKIYENTVATDYLAKALRSK